MKKRANPSRSILIGALSILLLLMTGTVSLPWCQADTSAPNMIGFPALSHIRLQTQFIATKPSSFKSINAYEGHFEIKTTNLLPSVTNFKLEVIGIFYQGSTTETIWCENFLAQNSTLMDFTTEKEHNAGSEEMKMSFGHEIGSMIYLVKEIGTPSRVYAIRSKVELVKQ